MIVCGKRKSVLCMWYRFERHSDDFATCEEGDDKEEDVVAKLEDYLNKLWAEEVAQKKNPSYVPRTIEPPGLKCLKCKD